MAADPLGAVARLAGVPGAVDAARAAVDTLLAHRALRRRSAEVTTESTLRSARASAALDGADLPLEALRAHLTGPADPTGAPDDLTTVQGVVRLYAGLGALRTAWARAPRQALARMHVLAAAGLMPDAELGRPRSGGPAAVDDPLRLGQAPPAGEVTARLAGLSDLLLAPTSAPAIVTAAVTHGELLALRTFGRLDGPVARAAGRLVLVGRGLDPKSLTAVEVGHVEAGGYAQAARGYLEGTADGVARWVIHCARAVELGARDSLAVCEAMARTG
jgi:hypothetical protein